MKKVVKTALPPTLLSAYLGSNQNAEWEEFQNNDRDGYEQVRQILRLDQRGLCAYCEIDLAVGHGVGLDDFRVEHFFPKKPHIPPPNWSLDWSNLLAVCTGGNARYVVKGRFTSPDYSCDVPKGNKNWTADILNPLTDVPAFPRLFRYDEQTGAMAADEELCPEALKAKANATIKLLQLGAATSEKTPISRLQRFRAAVIDQLREEILALLEEGLDEQAAAAQLAEVHFPADTNTPWPAFFTCIRWYLGPAAEARLKEIAFDG